MGALTTQGGMTVNDFIAIMRNHRGMCPRIICYDGFTMSVQASAAHRCNLSIDAFAPATTVEIGCLSQPVAEFAPYCEVVEDRPGHEIYTFVPVALVNEVIDQHGGVKDSRW